MMCSCCSIKCWFIFFNSLFLASGVALIIIGVLQYSTFLQMGTFTGSTLSKISIVLISVGVTIVLISLLGHIGAFINNFSMMTCFICILILIIILELLTGAAFYIFFRRSSLLQVNSGINSKARLVIFDYNPENRHAINRLQEKLRCCGADSFTDWSRSEGWRNASTVPDSCCVVKSQDCGKDMTNLHKKGCIWAIKLFLLKNVFWVATVCIVLGLTEIFGVLLSVCLCISIKQKNYEHLR